MPHPRRPAPVARTARLLAAVALLVGGLHALGQPHPAGAAVQHVAGYRATVLGWSSWYGSYGLGAHGTAWCIDHGIRAPDPALRYVPTTLSGVSAGTQTALAWAYGRYGQGPDRVTSAALMLVGHDLMGARYPYGRLDVGALTDRSIAGFGADGPAVLARARAIRADALARSGLRAPWRLTIVAPPPGAGGRGTATVRITAGGVGVAGIAVALTGTATPGTVTTGADGTARVPFTAPSGHYRLTATARVPDLALQVFAPTAAAAQRVARAATVDLHAAAEGTPAATTTSAPPTTSTTVLPPTTSTTSTTLLPTTTSTSTTVPPPTTSTSTSSTTSTSTSTSTSTIVPSTSTSLPAPPPPAPPPALPRTGVPAAPLASTGAGLVLLGTSLPRPRRRPG